MNIVRRIEYALWRYKLFEPQKPQSLGKTLFVIDIDHADGWRPSDVSGEDERQRVAFAISDRIAEARKFRIPVIFVMLDPFGVPKPSFEPQLKQEKHCIGCDRKENKLAEFLDHRHTDPFDPVFVKHGGDAFTNPELAPHLRSIGTKELVLVGCNTFACVWNTAVGAVQAGFDITLLEDSTYPPFRTDGGYDTKESWLASVRSNIANVRELPSIKIGLSF